MQREDPDPVGKESGLGRGAGCIPNQRVECRYRMCFGELEYDAIISHGKCWAKEGYSQ